MKKKQLSKIFEEDSDLPQDEVEITGKIVDLSDLNKEEVKVLQLKEKVFIDKTEMDYPIVMIQLKNGKYIILDVNESAELISNEE